MSLLNPMRRLLPAATMRAVVWEVWALGMAGMSVIQ